MRYRGGKAEGGSAGLQMLMRPALAAGLLLSASCPALQRGFIRAAVECGGELVTAVAGDLDAPDWEARLGARAAVAGVNAVVCAIGQILAELGSDGHAMITTVPLRRARGTAWLAAHHG